MKKLYLLFLVMAFVPVFSFADELTGNADNFSGHAQGTGFLGQMHEMRKNQISGAWDQIKSKRDDLKSQYSGFENEIKKNWQDFNSQYSSGDKSWKWSYTSGSKEAVKALRQQKETSEKTAFEALKSLYKAGTGDAESTFYTPRIEGLNAFYSGMAQYITSGSVDKYNQFVLNIMNVYKTNSELRVQKFNDWTNFDEYRKSVISTLSNLPEGLGNKLETILDKIPDAKKEKALNNLISVVEKRIEKIQSSNLTDEKKNTQINYLNGIKELAQTKLDAIQNSSSVSESSNDTENAE